MVALTSSIGVATKNVWSKEPTDVAVFAAGEPVAGKGHLVADAAVSRRSARDLSCFGAPNTMTARQCRRTTDKSLGLLEGDTTVA